MTGLIVGAIARLLIPGRQLMVCLLALLLGSAGVLAGSGITWLIWGHPGELLSGYAWPGYLFAIFGGVLLFGFWSASTRREVS